MIECRVLDVVDAQDGVERAALAFMGEFHPIDVVRNSAGLLRDGDDLILGNIDEFRVGIDEAPDEPGTGDAVDLRVFSRHPLAWSCPDVAACGQSLLNPI